MNDRRVAGPPRRGSTYILVLTLAAMIAVIGLGSLAVARVNLRASAERAHQSEAEELAMSAVEHGLTVIADASNAAAAVDADWRAGFAHGQISPPRSLGSGTCRWMIFDDTGDEDLADDAADPVRLMGMGMAGSAKRFYSVLLVPAGEGLEVLTTALHTAGDLTNNLEITAVGGPVSAAGSVFNNDTIDGDVEAGWIGSSGSITGTETHPAPPKDMPPSSLFQTYWDRATEISWFDFWQFDPGLLSAAVNPYGPENEDGVYRITVPSWEQLKIKPGRIKGTLVISAGYKAKIKIQDQVIIEPHRPDYPALIVAGTTDVKVEFGWPAGVVSEAAVGMNLNPGHTPWEGESDDDLADTYAPGIRGIVHIIDPLTEVNFGDPLVAKHFSLTGTLINEGDIVTKSLGSASFAVDPALFVNPPDGYATGNAVAPLAGSWRWETLP